MKIALGSDIHGFELKKQLKLHLEKQGYEVLDVTSEQDLDFFDATTEVSKVMSNEEADRAIMIDEYGVGSSIVANKYKGIICAHVADEHSAEMTVRHNSTKFITIGSGMVGRTLAEKICDAFIHAAYDGGRHQIRVDMVNKMC